MTKQATLDPQIPSTALGVRVSVLRRRDERISNAIRECRVSPQLEGNGLLNLSEKVRPLALGGKLRSRKPIRDIAGKMLGSTRKQSDEAAERIIPFPCSDSGSRDYTISRREAVEFGLGAGKCSEKPYDILKKLRKSFT